MKNRRNILFTLALIFSLFLYSFSSITAEASTGKHYSHVLGDYEKLMVNDSNYRDLYNSLLNFANEKNNLPSSSCVKDSNGDDLLSGSEYYFVVSQGHLYSLIDADIQNAENRGITYETWLGDQYTILADDMGVSVQVYHKDWKGVDGIKIAKGDQVYFKFSTDDRYFDFTNGNGWGDIWLESNPDGGVATLEQYNDRNVFVKTATVTRYYDKYGRMCDWYEAERTITSNAWFGFKSGTFFNSDKRWLGSEFYVSPWSPGSFIFVPATSSGGRGGSF